MLTDGDLREVLVRYRNIAVVGLSGDPRRPSHEVARYLLDAGYTVIPVNPNEDSVLGLESYPSLAAVPAALGPVEIVDVFRRPEHLAQVVDSAVAAGARVVWAQLGVVDEAAAARARQAGLQIVMDRCIAVEHRRLIGVSR